MGESFWLTLIEVLITHFPKLAKVILMPLRYRARKLIGSKVQILEKVIENALSPPKGFTAPSPFSEVDVKIDVDNRSPYILKIQRVFIRTWINYAYFKEITWDAANDLPDYQNNNNKEIDIYPLWARLEKDTHTMVRLKLFLPPFIPRDKDIYIGLHGLLVIGSPFGHFSVFLNDILRIDSSKWVNR